MLLATSVAYSQVDTVPLTAKQVYSDVKTGFSKLVSTLEGPAKHTYEVYVTQYKTQGILLSMLMTVGLIVGIISFFYAAKRSKWEEANKFAAVQIFGGILTVALLIGLFSSGYTYFLQMFNPEYYAIQEIINTIK